MKFLASIIGGCFACVILLLCIGLIFRCEHTNKIELFSFPTEKSTTMGYVKTKCEECDESFGYSLFRENPSNTSYIDTVEKHIEGNALVRGEYQTVTASVVGQDYDSKRAYIACKIRDEDVVVSFWADFKDEYGSALEAFENGEEITFIGKCSDTGFYWKDCELIK